ncbi:alpha/beta hydrolase [Nocardia nova]|uniref:alpha/beta hydrolase n=1 Tax=Nocardia nova TaxID=37330 RepID=UPI0033CE2A13
MGDRFAISVSVPVTYELTDEPLPVLYATDGNVMAPLSDGVAFSMSLREAITQCRPYIQVNIGYPADRAPDMLTIRNRDLVPPGEPISDAMYPYIREHLGVDLGHAPQEAMDQFFDSYSNGRGDLLLRFLEHELHPEISSRFRVDDDDIALLGYSFGGLLTAYALASGTQFFAHLGACSPAIVVDDSVVFAQYRKLAEAGAPSRDIHLHLTVNTYEMNGHTQIYRHLGIGSLRFLDMVVSAPIPGLTVTSEFIAGQDHEAGLVDAYRSFVRAVYRLR